MWNEEYKDEYIKRLEDVITSNTYFLKELREKMEEMKRKLERIKVTVDLFNGIDNDFIVKTIIEEFNNDKR